MAAVVELDSETRALMDRIEAVLEGQDFSAVATALEAVLARALLRQQGGKRDPFWSNVAAQMVSKHMAALLDCEGLLS